MKIFFLARLGYFSASAQQKSGSTRLSFCVSGFGLQVYLKVNFIFLNFFNVLYVCVYVCFVVNCKSFSLFLWATCKRSDSPTYALALSPILYVFNWFALFSQPSIYIDGWLYMAWAWRLSSVTFRYCLKTIPHIIILSSRHESDIPSLPGRQVSSS